MYMWMYKNCVQVETDLSAIPVGNMDKNYVDTWLEKQMVEYEKEKGVNSATNIFRAIMAAGKSGDKSKTKDTGHLFGLR